MPLSQSNLAMLGSWFTWSLRDGTAVWGRLFSFVLLWTSLWEEAESRRVPHRVLSLSPGQQVFSADIGGES